MYEIRFGVTEHHKIVKMSDHDHALGFYDRVKRFVEYHKLPWTVALWNDGWLEKSETFRWAKEATA